MFLNIWPNQREAVRQSDTTAILLSVGVTKFKVLKTLILCNILLQRMLSYLKYNGHITFVVYQRSNKLPSGDCYIVNLVCWEMWRGKIHDWKHEWNTEYKIQQNWVKMEYKAFSQSLKALLLFRYGNEFGYKTGGLQIKKEEEENSRLKQR